MRGAAASTRALRRCHPTRRASRVDLPLQGRWGEFVTAAVTLLLTIVPDYVIYDLSRSPKDAFRRQAERWSGCGARG